MTTSLLDYMYMVMELEAQSLRQWITNRNKDLQATIDRPSMYAIFHKICQGMAYISEARGNGTLSGVLKPSNILLTRGKEVKLSCFGSVTNPARQNLTSHPDYLYLPTDAELGACKKDLDNYSLG